MENKLLENENTLETLEPKDENLEHDEEAIVTDVEAEEEVAESTEEFATEEATTEETVEEAVEEAEESEEEWLTTEAPTEPEAEAIPAPVEEAKENTKPKEKKTKKNETHNFDYSNEEIKDFSKKIKGERIFDKVCLALLLLAIAIPVGLLGYIIYTIVSFFI